jgi:hypothetical protein
MKGKERLVKGRERAVKRAKRHAKGFSRGVYALHVAEKPENVVENWGDEAEKARYKP